MPSAKPGGSRHRAKAERGPKRAERGSRSQSPPAAEAALRELGASVRALREASGLTQETAAARAEIDYKRWQRIEQGRVNPTLRTLLRVAEVLDVDAWRLLTPRKRS